MKKLLHDALVRAGFEVNRIRKDTELYQELYGSLLDTWRFFNIGAAWFNHPMWANVDYPSKRYEKGQKKLDIEWDLMELGPLDVPDDTAIAVCTSHTIEHVAEQAAVNLFEEALRVLRRGGFFRVTTNDSEVYLRAYQNGDAHCYQIRGHPELPLHQAFMTRFATQAVNSVTRDELDELLSHGLNYALDTLCARCSYDYDNPQNDLSWWSKERTVGMLVAIGFDDVYVSGYGQSACPVMRNTCHFDRTHPRVLCTTWKR